MEEEYRYQHELFPSPERIDKVNNFTVDNLLYFEDMFSFRLKKVPRLFDFSDGKYGVMQRR